PDWEDDFNHWYNNHQIPIRLGCTGFQSAQRYKDPERSVYLGLFEIDTLERLESPEYSKIRSQPNAQSAWMLSNSLQYERYTGDEISTFCAENTSIEEALEAQFLRAIFFSVPDKSEGQFNKWYDEEYTPSVLRNSGWLMVRRFLIDEFDPSPWTHVTLQYIQNKAALSSEERRNTSQTASYKVLAEEPWFRPSFQVFEKHQDRVIPA
ncbi:MAG: hypothetical protein VW557_10745, partial [Rhodospirillaceae bacterium]